MSDKAGAAKKPRKAAAKGKSRLRAEAMPEEVLSAPAAASAEPEAPAVTAAVVEPVLHEAHLVHATYGRVRLRVPAARGNAGLLGEIRAAFDGHVGVDKVEVKPAAHSVVIYYDAEHHADIGALFASLGTTKAPARLPKMNGSHPHHEMHHAPKTELDEKLSKFEEEAEFLAEHSHVARTIVDTVKGLDRQIKRVTNNNLDLKILAPVGLAGFTFLEIGAAAATPMWVTLMIFSLNHFVELRAHTAGEDDDDGPVDVDKDATVATAAG